MNKHFLLGAGLALVVTFTASSVFAQSLPVPLQGGLMPCGSLGSKMVTGPECDAADAAADFKPDALCAVGQIPTNEKPCMLQLGQQQMGQQLQPVSSDVDTGERDSLEQALATGRLKTGQTVSCRSAGGQQLLVEVCLQAAKDAIASGGNFSMPQNQQFNQQQSGFPQQQNQNFQQNQQFNNQQSLFGQQQFSQQQTQPKIISPTIKSSGTTLVSKGLKLALKMQSSLNSKYSQAKGKTKKLAAVRSIAKKLPTLCRYISSGDDEADLDENAFDCDAFVAELSEPIGDALKAKDYEVAYESTVAALESFGEVFESLQQ